MVSGVLATVTGTVVVVSGVLAAVTGTVVVVSGLLAAATGTVVLVVVVTTGALSSMRGAATENVRTDATLIPASFRAITWYT